MLSCGEILANSQSDRPVNYSSVRPSRSKQLADFRSDSFQLFAVDGSKLLQDSFAATGELNENLAAILGGRRTNDQFLRHQPINQSNRAVVAKLQSFGQLAHGDLVASRESP